MQTLSFTPKLLRQRRFFSFLLPLFALFVGLGFSQSVLAQSAVSDNVTLNVRGTSANYDTQTSTPGPGVFNGTNFGNFNLTTGDIFSLNGATFTINDPGNVYNDGQFIYRVYQTSAGSGAFTTVQLGTGTYSGGIRTFTITPNINILSGLVGGAGTAYTFDVFFRANDNNTLGSPITSAPIKTATFTVTGAPIAPTSAGPPNNAQSTVLINTVGTTTPNTVYTASAFSGQNLGTYDINDGKLTLNGGTLNTFESGGDVVQSARLQYLIVKPPQNGQPGFAFPQSEIALIQDGTGTAATGGTKRSFSNSTALRNLISGLANQGIGNYTITVTYEAVVLRANGSTFRVRDDNGGNGYTASFVTTGVPILIDTWTGGVDDDWFNAANWDLKIVPTANINVIIPDFGVGNTKPYPNINAGVVFNTFGGSGPAVDNTNSGPALCRNIDMQGSSQAQRSILRLVNGRWKVYGSFLNSFDSYIQRIGSLSPTVIEFASTGNQTISGGSFTRIELSGGGTKNVTNIMFVGVSMNFTPNGGLLTTDISSPDNNYIELSNRSVDAPNGAQLTGETDAAYIRGFVITRRTSVAANETDPVTGQPDPRTFGNIGITLLFGGVNNPGDILITRNTAESYTPLVPTNGGTARFGIRRIFGVRPSFSGPLVATLTFRYLDTELTNLGPQGTGTVPEPNLALFVSTSGGNQFGGLGRDALDQVNNILTKSGVRTFATFTLGDIDKPLPVSLTGFDAKRIGADALVAWQTASEQNNKGFNVQVSTDGKTYRTIGFVASETPNSTAPKAYTFTDAEKNKAGSRYYRLEQVDLNGKSTFFAPRLVTFEGKATETSSSIVAYPNPLNNEILHLSLNSSVSGTAVVHIMDMTGRQVGQRQVAITLGSNDVTVENMSELKSGLYILNVMLPSGEKKTMKVTKQ
jgi:Secretion system C-terminal sorting domain